MPCPAVWSIRSHVGPSIPTNPRSQDAEQVLAALFQRRSLSSSTRAVPEVYCRPLITLTHAAAAATSSELPNSPARVECCSFVGDLWE